MIRLIGSFLLGVGLAWAQEVPAQPLEREIQAGQVHEYRLPAEAGKYLHVSVEQRGWDVHLMLLDADGKRLVNEDRMTAGMEDLHWIFGAAGEYRVQVSAVKAPAGRGRYVLKVQLRDPSGNDRIAAHAFQLAWTEAQQIRRTDSAEARRRAVAVYQDGLSEWRRLGSHDWESYILYEIATLKMELNDPKGARDAFAESLELRRAYGSLFELSLSLNAMGTVSSNAGDVPAAVAYYQETLEVRRKLGDRQAEGVALNNLGLAVARRGSYTEARELYEQALAIRREVGDRPGERSTLSNLSNLFRDTGQYQQSLDYAIQSLEIRRELGNAREIASTLVVVGGAYMNLGDYSNARKYFQEAEAQFEEVGDLAGQAAVAGREAEISMGEGDYKQALALYERGIQLRRKTGDRRNEAVLLTASLGPLIKLGQIDKLRETAELLLTKTDLNMPPRMLVNSRTALALVHQAHSEREQARQELTLAESLARSAGDTVAISALDLQWAKLERESGDLPAALARAEEAMQIVESQRAAVGDANLRATFFAARTDRLAMYVSTLMALDRQNPAGNFAGRAFEANERWRARSTTERIAAAEADLREALTAEQKSREQVLLTRVSTVQSELFRPGVATARTAVLKQQLSTAEREFELFQAELRQSGLRYAEVEYADILGVDRIRRELLPAGAALVEYSLGEKESYVWAVTPDGFYSATLPARAQIEDRVTAFRKELSTPVTALNAASALQRANTQSRELYRMLVAPVEGALGKAHKLILVPDGALSYLPFEVLGSPAPLIERVAVSYAPSASTLAALQSRQKQRSAPSKMLLAFADPVVGGSSSAKVSTYTERGFNFVRLPSTREEVTGIQSLFKPGATRAYLGLQAREQSVKSEALTDYRFVHFATHGYFDEEQPGRSGIVFSPGTDSQEDGVLQVPEILRLKLNADLVTLSACQTGLGKLLAGEGVLGLTRAFLFAGSQSVVVSLWNVNDTATSSLMKAFYQGLNRGLSREDALRAAKLALIRGANPAWKHPYFWAPFVFVGDAGLSAQRHD